MDIVNHLVFDRLAVDGKHYRQFLDARAVSPGSASNGGAVVKRGRIVNSERTLSKNQLAGVFGKKGRAYGVEHAMYMAVGAAPPQRVAVTAIGLVPDRRIGPSFQSPQQADFC